MIIRFCNLSAGVPYRGLYRLMIVRVVPIILRGLEANLVGDNCRGRYQIPSSESVFGILAKALQVHPNSISTAIAMATSEAYPKQR